MLEPHGHVEGLRFEDAFLDAGPTEEDEAVGVLLEDLGFERRIDEKRVVLEAASPEIEHDRACVHAAVDLPQQPRLVELEELRDCVRDIVAQATCLIGQGGRRTVLDPGGERLRPEHVKAVAQDPEVAESFAATDRQETFA